MLDDLDAGTLEDLQQDPRLRAQLALLAKITTRLGLIGSLRLTCPHCRTVDALQLSLRGGGHASCSECRRRTTLSDLLKERDPMDELDKSMRRRPRP